MANLLGIYLTKDSATAVCFDPQAKGDKVPVCFTVTAKDQEQPKIPALASRLAQGCSERKLSFSEVAVAIDCSLYMQHGVHSEFSDPKQIASTIRFDTEETLATDISETALAFEIDSKGQAGSELTVFTAQKKILSEILLSLQQYNFDPITIKPDVICLSKLIFNKVAKSEPVKGFLFAMLSERSGYLIAPRDRDGSGSYNTSLVRTFLVGPKQNRTELLAREILVTTALLKGDDKTNSLRISDSAGAVDFYSITERTGILAKRLDLFPETHTSTADGKNKVNQIDCAIAYGAALSLQETEQTVNFRDDFSPFQGKKIKTQRAFKFAMVSVTVLLIAVGLYFQLNLFSLNRYIKQSREKFSKNYEIVMEKKLSSTASTKTALKNLNKELDSIKKGSAGIITEGTSVSSRLTLVLSAFVKCAKQTGLIIDSINVTENNISITGSTLNRTNTTTFLSALRDTGLDVKGISQNTTRRDNFSVSLEPKSLNP
jgi:hypothetical protein